MASREETWRRIASEILDHGQNPRAIKRAFACRFLLQLDIEGCHKRQAAVLGVRELEASVAAALGLPVIFTKAHLTLQPSYRVFLEALAAAVQKRGPLFQPLASDVSLQVKGKLFTFWAVGLPAVAIIAALTGRKQRL